MRVGNEHAPSKDSMVLYCSLSCDCQGEAKPPGTGLSAHCCCWAPAELCWDHEWDVANGTQIPFNLTDETGKSSSSKRQNDRISAVSFATYEPTYILAMWLCCIAPLIHCKAWYWYSSSKHQDFNYVPIISEMDTKWRFDPRTSWLWPSLKGFLDVA